MQSKHSGMMTGERGCSSCVKCTIWWGMLTWGGSGCWRRGVSGKSLYLPLNFAVNLELPFNKIPEKAMAPYSSTLAWKIPWMEEPGRVQSMGSLRVGHD